MPDPRPNRPLAASEDDSGKPKTATDGRATEAAALLAPLEWIELSRYSVVGPYLRFDHRTRHTLKEFRQRAVATFAVPAHRPKNFLLWGAPGSGKSYLVQQLARVAGDGIEYLELNVGGLEREQFRSRLEGATNSGRPLLCLVDEVDARPGEAWPFETLLPYLDPASPRGAATCYCLAGSGGANLGEFKDRLLARPKGADLLSRIPRGNEVAVAPLDVGDRLLVSLAQLALAASEEGRELREVEKLALYYLAVDDELVSARRLRDVAIESIQRMPPGEDRLRYDHLFAPGDPLNKAFWARAAAVRDSLSNRFLAFEGRALTARAVAAVSLPSAVALVPPKRLEDSRWVGVLPFASYSPDPADEYFADGMTEELISALARIDGLKVISRTSVMTYKGRVATASLIGRELGVGTLLEGSVRKAGSRVRITAQLIDVRNDRPTWSETYDRDFGDLLAIQSDIARRVAEAARGRVLGHSTAPAGARNPATAAAHALYLKGRFFWNRTTREWLEKALDQFEQAIAADPTYAPAFSGLAESYLLLGRRGDLPAAEVYPKAVSNAERALALDPDLAEPHAALGAIRQEYEWKWAESEREFLRALELKPSSSTAHAWYGLYLGHVGRFDEAVAEAEQARELDPFATRTHCWAAEELVFSRRFEEALGASERALEIDPQFGPAHAQSGIALVEMGRYDEAIDRFENANRLFGAQAVAGRLGHAHAKAGHADAARRMVTELAAARTPHPSANPALPPSPYNSLDVALVHLGLGETAEAIRWLELARDQRVPEVVHYAHEPIYAPIRDVPAFRALVRSIGL
jgi:TolB-like protein/Tfp pilus assembly protein PilF